MYYKSLANQKLDQQKLQPGMEYHHELITVFPILSWYIVSAVLTLVIVYV